jgi:hypothetical protein
MAPQADPPLAAKSSNSFDRSTILGLFGTYGRIIVPSAAAASRGNIVLFRGQGNHVDLRGLEPMAIAGAVRSRAILACR